MLNSEELHPDFIPTFQYFSKSKRQISITPLTILKMNMVNYVNQAERQDFWRAIRSNDIYI